MDNWTDAKYRQLAAEIVYEWGHNDDWPDLVEEYVAGAESPRPEGGKLLSAIVDRINLSA